MSLCVLSSLLFCYSLGGSVRWRMTLAGFPPTTQKGGTSFVTTALAATTVPSPMVMPGRMVALSPIHTFFPMCMPPFDTTWRSHGRRCKSSQLVVPCELSTIVTHLPVSTPSPKVMLRMHDIWLKAPKLQLFPMVMVGACPSTSHAVRNKSRAKQQSSPMLTCTPPHQCGYPLEANTLAHRP